MVVINGQPMGKQRPKVTLVNGYGRAYTPTKTINYETLVKLEYQNQDGTYYDEGSLSLKVVAYYQIPKSFSKKKRMQAITGELRPTVKPDLDNVLKIICDALNKVAYKDDNQITNIEIKKFYAEIPRVEFSLEKISD